MANVTSLERAARKAAKAGDHEQATALLRAALVLLQREQEGVPPQRPA